MLQGTPGAFLVNGYLPSGLTVSTSSDWGAVEGADGWAGAGAF